MPWLKKYPVPDFLQIRWCKRPFLDDVIPGRLFGAVCKARRSSHLCVERNGAEVVEAQFLITVKAREAVLDYSDQSVWKYNKRRDIEPGNMRLVFAGPSRTLVREVIWQDSDGKETREAANTSWDVVDFPEDVLGKLPKLDKKYETLVRKEQRILRGRLFSGASDATCAICGNVYPIELVVAAHIKKRSECSNSEKRDLANVIPMCKFGCDDLFERGYVFVRNGRVAVSRELPLNKLVESYVERIRNRPCPHWNRHSARYFRWHGEKPKVR